MFSVPSNRSNLADVETLIIDISPTGNGVELQSIVSVFCVIILEQRLPGGVLVQRDVEQMQRKFALGKMLVDNILVVDLLAGRQQAGEVGYFQKANNNNNNNNRDLSLTLSRSPRTNSQEKSTDAGGIASRVTTRPLE
jgi:hypothetical protein